MTLSGLAIASEMQIRAGRASGLAPQLSLESSGRGLHLRAQKFVIWANTKVIKYEKDELTDQNHRQLWSSKTTTQVKYS